jgi:hypothetical protein
MHENPLFLKPVLRVAVLTDSPILAIVILQRIRRMVIHVVYPWNELPNPLLPPIFEFCRALALDIDLGKASEPLTIVASRLATKHIVIGDHLTKDEDHIITSADIMLLPEIDDIDALSIEEHGGDMVDWVDVGSIGTLGLATLFSRTNIPWSGMGMMDTMVWAWYGHGMYLHITSTGNSKRNENVTNHLDNLVRSMNPPTH